MLKAPFPPFSHVRVSNIFLMYSEFTDHQRNVFCVFSGEGVHNLRDYLNADPRAAYNPEETMFDDHEGEDAEPDQTATMAGMMHATGLGADDEDMEEYADMSQYGGEVDG